MIYRSEILKKDFKTEAECLEAESKYTEKKEKLKNEKSARAAEVELAYKDLCKARTKYYDLAERFEKDYNSEKYLSFKTVFNTDYDILHKLFF